MRLWLTSLFCGLLFGAGLTVSGMIDPGKVLGFLDLAGDWDPTLAFVMVGAIVGAIPGFRLAARRSHPRFAARFQIPTSRTVDARLLAGAVLFGLGWGLVGFCPGPALAALGSGRSEVAVFVAAMLAGMVLFRLLPSGRGKR